MRCAVAANLLTSVTVWKLGTPGNLLTETCRDFLGLQSDHPFRSVPFRSIPFHRLVLLVSSLVFSFYVVPICICLPSRPGESIHEELTKLLLVNFRRIAFAQQQY